MHVDDGRVNALQMKVRVRRAQRVASTRKSVPILRTHNHGKESLTMKTKKLIIPKEGEPCSKLEMSAFVEPVFKTDPRYRTRDGEVLRRSLHQSRPK